MDKLTTFDKSKQKSNFFGKVYSLYRQALKKVIEEEGIILTTYRELMERRKAVNSAALTQPTL